MNIHVQYMYAHVKKHVHCTSVDDFDCTVHVLTILYVCSLQLTCSVCGQKGHMKTNKNCPMYKNQPIQVC